ncbi:cytochrome P450 [Aspergillus japonicus CBS 114.51]|uniref:Cytochrome P450 n=1 Tax=Aspergillus japonicus CBS 114.51 TaxID=1448312 RepID=A0A8T8XFH8_ASPJA|nr:cytochrome P450 [Aspergillus japonicus CBS 114.51]RAH86925.1 cytochrome P450 [Aspergillus japonicus CBS 114.51]
MLLLVIALLSAMLAFAYTFRQYAHLNWAPDPLISRILWWWHIYLRNSPHDGRKLTELHSRYGRIVHLGKNRISVSDPNIIAQLYQFQCNSINGFEPRDADACAQSGRDFQIPTSKWARFLEYEGINETSTKELLRALRVHQSIELVACLRIFAATLIDRCISDPAPDTTQIQTQAINALSLPIKPSIIEYLLFQSPISSLKSLHKPNSDSSNILLNDNSLTSDNLTAETESLITAFASVFPYLLQQPEKLTTLQNEIDSAYNTGSLSSNPRWRELSRLPYLCAVMKESMRLTCTSNMDKEFPASAVSDDLRSEPAFPSGTIISCNAYVAHFSDTIYGDDTRAFRPERWLTASVPQRKLMDKTMLLFHPGLRANLKLRAAWLELKKVVVQMLLNLNIQSPLVEDHAVETPDFSAKQASLLEHQAQQEFEARCKLLLSNARADASEHAGSPDDFIVAAD